MCNKQSNLPLQYISFDSFPHPPPPFSLVIFQRKIAETNKKQQDDLIGGSWWTWRCHRLCRPNPTRRCYSDLHCTTASHIFRKQSIEVNGACSSICGPEKTMPSWTIGAPCGSSNFWVALRPTDRPSVWPTGWQTRSIVVVRWDSYLIEQLQLRCFYSFNGLKAMG